MKNKIGDLRNELFAQLEKLGEEDCDLDKEIKRSRAMCEIAAVMIDSGRAENEFLKIVETSEGVIDSEFFQLESKKLTQGSKTVNSKVSIPGDGLKDA